MAARDPLKKQLIRPAQQISLIRLTGLYCILEIPLPILNQLLFGSQGWFGDLNTHSLNSKKRDGTLDLIQLQSLVDKPSDFGILQDVLDSGKRKLDYGNGDLVIKLNGKQHGHHNYKDLT